MNATQQPLVRCRSIPSAAAVVLLTGVTPEVRSDPYGNKLLLFPSECRAALEKFMATKDRLDALVAGA